MVALLHPEDFPNEPVARPQLRLVQGGATSPAATSMEGKANTVALALAVVVVMLFVLFRIAQGTPPASSWDGVANSAYGESAYGASANGESASAILPPVAEVEEVYIVQPGDSLWAIAERLAPGQDPRSLVDAMSERNGGSALQVGQQLVIPLRAGS